MTSICSVILAFMLSIGGGANLSVHLSEKPHPGLKIETSQLRPIQTELNQEQQPVLRFFIRNSCLGVRFLQTDPMGYEDSLNLYQAFNQNPVNFVDPMGLVLKLSPSEMVDFKENLYKTISDLYYQKYAIEQNNFEKYQLIMGAVIGYDLKTLVKVFNKETELNLEVPEEMGFFDRIFGTSASFFSMSEKVGEKVRKFFGSEEAQERIKKAQNHWLVQKGICLPGLLTIGDQLNLAFANGAGSFAKFTTEEIQWIMVAGVLKGGIKYINKARQLGKEGELIAGINRAKIRIRSLTRTAKYRIPDELIHKLRMLREVKNVKRLSYTRQIKDFNLWCQKKGYRFILEVRPGAKLSKPLLREIELGNIILWKLAQ